MKKKGILYVVATPIGNMLDITYRALNILKKVNFIMSENCLNTLKILKYFKIKKKMILFNQHNENKKLNYILSKLKKNNNIALVSNAGTPLINDPGFKLIKKCHKKKIRIIPIPGACAAITALCVSGISTNKFLYYGFLPKKKKKKKKILKKFKKKKYSIIFYESNLRIKNTLKKIYKIFEKNRNITIARELTKYWENILYTKIKYLFKKIKKKKIIFKGEFVIIIEKYKKNKKILNTFNISKKNKKFLKILSQEVSINIASKIASKILSKKKNFFYKYFLNLKKNKKKIMYN